MTTKVKILIIVLLVSGALVALYFVSKNKGKVMTKYGERDLSSDGKIIVTPEDTALKQDRFIQAEKAKADNLANKNSIFAKLDEKLAASTAQKDLRFSTLS